MTARTGSPVPWGAGAMQHPTVGPRERQHPATSHHGAGGDGGPCHVPPWGHGRGSTLPRPTTGQGPPIVSHHGAGGEGGPCHVPPRGHRRGSTLPRPTTGQGPPIASHHGAGGEGGPCHVPPRGHGRGGTLPRPTMGPPPASHHASLGTALARGSRRRLTLRRVPQSEQPAHRHPTAVMWAAASSTCGKEEATGGRRGAARSTPAPQTREEGRGANRGTHGDAASPDARHGLGVLADVPLRQVL